MTYELEYLEILQAYIYYEDAQKGLGERFIKHLEKYLRRIQNNPKHFQLKKNYREAFIQKFPFLMVYDIIDYKIIIFSVFKTYQNPTKKP
nr:type II toxin-antitoxin system RelE/ParE family toxin [uncultured Chryseobacterium sp.]